MTPLIRTAISRNVRHYPVRALEMRPRPPADFFGDALQLIESGDLCSLISLAALLFFFGNAVLRLRPDWRSTTLRIAAFSFVVLLVFTVSKAGIQDPALLIQACIRSAVCAVLVMGLAAIFLPLGELLFQGIFGWPWRYFQQRRFRRLQAAHEKWRQSQSEWQQQAERRERALMAPILARQQTDQKRREEARFACQMLYDRYRARIETKFSPMQLQAHFEKYLPDTLSPEEVERRAAQLKELILELAESDGRNRPRFKSLIDLHEYYHRQQQAVLNSPYPEDVKQSLISDLAREEAKAIRESRQL